ncbi:hypothetical protein Dimus_010125 [Dionaea muscipula]
MKKPITNSTATACVRHQPITLQSSFLRHFEEPKHPPTCSSINGPSSYQPISKVSPSMQSNLQPAAAHNENRRLLKQREARNELRDCRRLDTSAQPMKPAQPNCTSM